MHQRDKGYAIHSIAGGRGVTPIDQLINLDDEEKNRDETLNKVKTRSIRNTGGKGGMSSYEKFYNTPEQKTYIDQGGDNDRYMEVENEGYNQNRVINEQYETRNMRGMYGDGISGNYNCVDVANHTRNCPVCSKLYNNDRSIYILIIGLLALICVILFKSKMEK